MRGDSKPEDSKSEDWIPVTTIEFVPDPFPPGSNVPAAGNACNATTEHQTAESKCRFTTAYGASMDTKHQDECLEAMKSLDGGLRMVREMVIDHFKADRWAAMVHMAEAMVHTRINPQFASQVLDWEAPSESGSSKWHEVVQILNNKKRGKEIELSELTLSSFPFKTIECYQTHVGGIEDTHFETGEDLRGLKKLAEHDLGILCALFVDVFASCKPVIGYQIFKIDYIGSYQISSYM
ncbi:MAG: hypothetical protein Q9170_000654 [Blastenia crenularia]